MMNIKRIGVTNILEKEVVFYNSWDNPLFLAKDIASWIGNKNHRDLLTRVDDDEKVVGLTDTVGGAQSTTFLTEDGLYETLMQSRKPIAKELRKKIKQHLKQIRKTGGSIEDGREEEFIDKYFPSFSEDVKLSMVQDLLSTNKELKPKADYYDTTLLPPNLKTTTDIAKDLGLSAQKLNKRLHLLKVIYPKKANGKTKGWYLYSEYEHLVPEIADYHINEYGQLLKWTEKGRQFIIDKLKELE